MNYANSTFVGVGSSGKILTSSDGISWDNRTTGTSNELNEVAYGNNTHVVVGGGRTLVYSTDGISWTYKTLFSGGDNLESIFYKE